jgi:hypothetical protein
MQEVFRLLYRVARTRATLLIRGETGTGKDLIARMVHAQGPTTEGPFITVDCTNIPAALMESELFGHERGAFTDAKTRKIGLMETADGGSIFLDEIGLMPLELQAKMLHVLETQRFRYVGGTVEHQVSVRFLAATNENLEEAVKEGKVPRGSLLSLECGTYRSAAAAGPRGRHSAHRRAYPRRVRCLARRPGSIVFRHCRISIGGLSVAWKCARVAQRHRAGRPAVRQGDYRRGRSQYRQAGDAG